MSTDRVKYFSLTLTLMLSERLDKLKWSLDLYEPMDVITQCEIVGEAVANGGPYMENYEGLALYLGVSKNHVYKMSRIHSDLVDEAKEYFRYSEYQPHTAFKVACLSPEKQRQWVTRKGQSFSI